MGRYGFRVIDADGHGGEPTGWRRARLKAAVLGGNAARLYCVA